MRRLIAGLGVLVIVDALAMFVVPEFSAPLGATIDTQPVTFLQQHLGDGRFFSLGPLTPNYSSYYGIAGIMTNQAPIPQAWASFVPKYLDANVDAVVFTGDHLSDPKGITPLQAFLTNMAAYHEIAVKYLFTLSGQLPAADAASSGLVRVFSDPVGDIYALPHPQPYFQVTAGQCSLAGGGKTRVTADCATPAVLYRRELYMPGWNATTATGSLAVRPSGPLFQEVRLPAGRSSVHFAFVPPGLGLAKLAFALGVAALLAGLTLGVVARPVHEASLTGPLDASAVRGGSAAGRGPPRLPR
ncbi:MAG: hypothetical protein NVSMB32_02810 [Actinomycetota bacterium]